MIMLTTCADWLNVRQLKVVGAIASQANLCPALCWIPYWSAPAVFSASPSVVILLNLLQVSLSILTFKTEL